MTFSVTLSVGDVHFKLIPTASSSSAQSAPKSSSISSSIGPSSPIVSVKCQPKAEQQGRANNATEAAERGEDDFDIVADLSQFSGTLCISSSAGGMPKNAAIYSLPKEETSVPHPKEEKTSPLPVLKEDDIMCLSGENINNFQRGHLEATLMPPTKSLDVDQDNQKSEVDEFLENEKQTSEVNKVAVAIKTKEEVVEKEEDNDGEKGAIDIHPKGSEISVSFDFDDDVNSEAITGIENVLDEQFDDNSVDSERQRKAIFASMRGNNSMIGRCSTSTRRFALTQMQTQRLFSNLSSELHAACASHDTPMATLRSILEANPKLAYARDAMGDMPIHVFARNEVLALSEEAEHAILFMHDLIKIAPQCIVTPSPEDDRIPFVSAIVHWIERAYKNRDETLAKDSLSSKQDQQREVGVSGSLTFHNLSRDEQYLIFLFPLNLSVTPFISWSLTMLSAALDILHKMRTLHRRKKTSAFRLNEARHRIIQEVSSIPLFCKTILMLESYEELSGILGLTIITNTFLHKNSIGPWLIAMFHGDRLAKTRAVEFLDFVSNMTVDDIVGGTRRWFQPDQDAFLRKRQEAFSAFAKLPGIIPATRFLGKRKLERATSTNIVHYALNDRIGQPLVLGALVFDGILHFILLVAYRFIALEVSDSSYQSNAAYLLVFIPAGYFIAREILTVSSIIMSSRKIFSLYLRNFWTMMDLISVVMAVWTTCFISTQGRDFDGALWIALTIVLLWFKVLGFLRYINRRLATFISSFFEILGAIKWFFLVLIIAIMLFGDALETILKFTPGSCEEDFLDPSNRMLSARDDFCSPHPLQSYVRIYSVVVGDVSLDDFQQTTLVTALFVGFTFFGIIVLLNILIAIVQDSYSKSIMRSYGLFGRARVELVVRQLAREYFTSPSMDESHSCGRNHDRISIFKKGLMAVRMIFSWIILAAVALIIIVVEWCLVTLSSQLGDHNVEGHAYFTSIFIALTVIYSVALCAAVIVVIDHFVKCSRNRVSRPIVRALSKLVTPFRQALEIDNSMQPQTSDYDVSDDWAGQLKYLEVKTKQTVQIAAEHLRNDMKAELRASEERQVSKMKMIENAVEGVKETLNTTCDFINPEGD